MIVGIARIRLRMPESLSLKAKRGIVKSVCARIQNKFSVACAEVESRDSWQLTEIGIACVSNERGHADSVLGHVIHYVESSRLDCEVLDIETELIDV